ncbi:DUF6731 family protein [Synechocystis sp. PCC 7509]|uniref:DUF6731 family protein n=1 Tax=Synechocystis sp. PCC 7509 TaxID=927677 RepID=UPI0002AC0202|nr:DUF6731 family protein [Synechocystis sp. PCC 7509]
MSKNLNIDFYKIVMPSLSKLSFESILDMAIQLPIRDRFQEINHSPLFLRQCLQNPQKDCWEGEIIRVRMNDLPIKANLSGDTEEFIFGDDEGIGEQTAFLYHFPTRVLLLQANQGGVSVTSFIQYFQVISTLTEQIFIDPVIQANAMQKLAKMQTVTKLDIQIAGLDKPDIFENQGHGIKKIVGLSKEYDAPIVTLTLSVGRKKQHSLSIEDAKNTIHDLLRISSQNKQDIKKIRISGSTEDHDLIYIDMLKDRMRESINIKKSRTLSHSDRIKAIREGLERREKELYTLYGD